MKIKVFLILIIVLSYSLISAQYDKKRIYIQEAQNLLKSRKYDQVEDVYKKGLQEFPQDTDLVLGLLNLYITRKDTQKGLTLIKENQNIIPQDKLIIYLLTYKLIDKDYEYASDKAFAFLKDNPSKNNYQTIGSLFQSYRAYTSAINIFTQGDKVYKNQFSFELGDAYYFDRNYSSALTFYINAIENNMGNRNLINSRISNIIKIAPNTINVMIDHFQKDNYTIEITKKNSNLVNIYVDALLNTGEYELAYPIIEKIQEKELFTKAERFRREKKFDISKMLYELLLTKGDNLNSYYMYMLNYANLLFETSEFTKADSLIKIIIEEEDNQKYKSSVLFDAYILKSELIRRNSTVQDKYQIVLKQARSYARNKQQINSVLNKLVNYQILKKDFKSALNNLEQINTSNKDDAYIFNMFLLHVYEGKNEADSLATEMIINFPESPLTNKMLELKYLLKITKNKEKNLFLDAYSAHQLFFFEKADSLYLELFSATENEYFVIINALMNIEINNYQRARQLLSYRFKDKFSNDFANLQVILLEHPNSPIAKDMARNYLSQYPYSVLAPMVRQILLIEQNN